jgi:hypothetical protein
MPTMMAELMTVLSNDPTLTAVLTGGIYDREIKSTGPGSTPAAFGPAGQVRPTASLVDRGETMHPAALIGVAPNAYLGFPLVYLYAQAVASGKAAIRDAKRRIRELVHGYRWTDDGGWQSEMVYLDSWGIHDSDEYPGAVYDYVRLSVRGHH